MLVMQRINALRPAPPNPSQGRADEGGAGCKRSVGLDADTLNRCASHSIL